MPDPSILAIDLGTGRLKAALVGLDGRVLAWGTAGYRSTVEGDRVEQDPGDWWSALESVVGEIRGQAPETTIAVICAVGQGPTAVAVGPDGDPTRPAIAWSDRRATAETAELAAATGLAPWLLGVLPSALWVERHEPTVAARTAHYLASWEWLTQRLTGIAAATRSAGQVVPDVLVAERAGLPAAKVPPVLDAGTVLGGLSAEAAELLGLPAAIPVVTGLNDAYASCLGAGLEAAGDAIDTGGRSGGIAVYTDREPRVPGAWIAPAPLSGRWLVGGAMAATGVALDWLRDGVLGGTSATETLLAEAAAVPAGADGLVFLPYLAGERSPIWDPAARGAFVGLTVGHGRGHLVRAVLEAAAYADRQVLEPIRAAGLPVGELRVGGGNARSPLWNRIKADALGITVAVPEVPDTTLVGAAVLATSGVGLARDVRAAMASMVRIRERLEPDPAAAAAYDRGYGVYRELYPALRDAMHALGG